MSRRWTVTVTGCDRVLKVRGWRAGEILRSIGKRPIYVGGAWTLDLHHAADIVAALEHAGARVVQVDLPSNLSSPTTASTVTTIAEPDLLDLIAAGGAA